MYCTVCPESVNNLLVSPINLTLVIGSPFKSEYIRSVLDIILFSLLANSIVESCVTGATSGIITFIL